jgi:hypothetical protein
MTTHSRTVFVAANHSIEDLPKGMGAANAADYLTAWTSLWDPRLLLANGALPEWRRCDASGLDLEDALVCCPEASLAKIDQPLQERLRLGRNSFVPSARRPRHEVVRNLLESHVDRASADITPDGLAFSVGDEACCHLDDFYAFGYAVLQVQCMARKLRYSFNLDWMAVGEQILSAAKASLRRDSSETDRWLGAAFDSLSQERDRYCSQQGNLLDLILLAPSTLGEPLTRTLEIDRPMTLYATTRILQLLQKTNHDAWGKLIQRLEDQSLCLAGGLRDELLHVWWPEDALIRELSDARDDFEQLGVPPTKVWMRFAPAIPTNLPMIAKQFGFQGAIIAPLAGGSIPKKEHAKIRWQAAGDRDRGGLDCILGHVLDAADCENLLHLGSEMAQQLDYHQVPTLVLAHWPGAMSAAFQDLVNAAKRTPALGKWMHAETYFATTSQPYWSDPYSSLDFHYPLPHDTLTIHARHNLLMYGVQQAYRLEQLESTCRLWSSTPRIKSLPQGTNLDLEGYLAQIVKLRSALYNHSESIATIAKQTDAIAADVLEELRARIPGDEDICFNATSHTKKVFLENFPGRIERQSSTRIIACDHDDYQSQCVVELPSYGFAKLDSQPSLEEQGQNQNTVEGSARDKRPSWLGRVFGSRPTVAQADGSMANEWMELQIDPVKGHLRSLYVANKRGNRLSGQLSWCSEPVRLRYSVEESSFGSVSQAQVRVVHSCKVRGTIEVTGQLGGGDCVIRYSLWQGARWLDIDVQCTGMDPKLGFPLWRMVWPSEAATIAAWSQGAKSKLPSPLQCAVELIEIDDAEHRIEFATGGLSMHRRVGNKGLATVLPFDEHSVCRASFSIGIDWKNPWEIAIDRMLPELVSVSKGRKQPVHEKTPDTGAWLARCNVSNLRFRWIDPQPALQVSPSSDAEGREDNTAICADGCWWIVETEGKSGTAKVGCGRAIDRAWRVDFRGLEYDKLRVEDGEVFIPFQGWERSRIAFCFKD